MISNFRILIFLFFSMYHGFVFSEDVKIAESAAKDADIKALKDAVDASLKKVEENMATAVESSNRLKSNANLIDDPKAKENALKEASIAKDKIETTKTNVENIDCKSDQFGCLGFGIGLGYYSDLGSHDRIKSASLVNGIVRISDDSNSSAKLILETHYFFTGWKPFNYRIGPFVAVQAGDDNIISSAALGLMLGFHNKTSGNFNLGLGFAADPDTQILGDGLSKDQPLPIGETEIRYKNTTQYGVVLVFSKSL